jgi:Tfp pilus assembly protein PilO
LIKSLRAKQIVDAVALALVKENLEYMEINYDEILLETVSQNPDVQKIAWVTCLALARQLPTQSELTELIGDDPTPTRVVNWGETLEHIKINQKN